MTHEHFLTYPHPRQQSLMFSSVYSLWKKKNTNFYNIIIINKDKLFLIHSHRFEEKLRDVDCKISGQLTL